MRPRPDDLTFDAADATLALIALSTKMRLDQIEPLDSIESLSDGASSRRNQLLVDLGSELNLGAIDGAAEADLAGLKSQVTKLARTYKPFGPVLSDAINDQLRTVLGPSGKRPAYIAERVKKTWELGDGWVKHVTVEVALGTRDGASVRGGNLGGLHDGALADAATVDKVIDAAVAAVGARQGRRGGAAVAGRRRVAAWSTPRRSASSPSRSPAPTACWPRRPGWCWVSSAWTTRSPRRETATDAELIDLVTAELGSDWPRLVAPAFDGRKAVLFDDRWASAREDLAAVADGRKRDRRRLAAALGAIRGRRARRWYAGQLVAGQGAGRRPQRPRVAVRPGRRRRGEPGNGPLQPTRSRWSPAHPRARSPRRWSLSCSTAARPSSPPRRSSTTTGWRSTARCTATTPATARRCGWCRPTWRPTPTSTRCVEWVGSEQTESLGPQSIHLKDARTPTLLFPFAAPRVAGDLSEAGSRSEMEMKVLLWAVERLIGGLSHIGADRDIASRLHVVLPGSPNRGMFGGDGAYGESKSALDAVVTRWKAESSWAQRVTPGARADRLDPRHRPDGSQRRRSSTRSRRPA